MNVRCKFVCREVTQAPGTVWDESGANPMQGMLWHAKFAVVTTGSAEDRKFFASTPSGTLEVGSVREMPWEPGKSYYIDISAADG